MNKSAIEIRHAKPEEWHAIRTLHVELMQFEKENFMPTWDLNYPFSIDAKKKMQNACADQDNLNAFVSIQNGAIIGFGILEQKDPKTYYHRKGVNSYYVSLLSVSKEHRNKGIGRKLIEHMKEYAKSEGATHISIELVAGNERAMHLYKDTGFKEHSHALEQKL